MNFINKFFFKLVSKNIKFKNKYLDQSCYIIGNGQSIKYLDLSKFSKKKTLTCSWMYLHKDYNKLDKVADIHFHPGIYSPVWKNPYSKKFEFNDKCKKFLYYSGRFEERVNLFTSVYHYPFLFKKKNIYYLHHFGKKDFEYNKIDPSKEFSLLFGSLFSMLGLAAYMGFSKIYLIGMDYLYDNPKNGHFYEYGVNKEDADVNNLYLERVEKILKFFSLNLNMKIFILSSLKFESKLLKNFSYEDNFKTNLKYKENFEIVKKNNLKGLSELPFQYSIYDN